MRAASPAPAATRHPLDPGPNDDPNIDLDALGVDRSYIVSKCRKEAREARAPLPSEDAAILCKNIALCAEEELKRRGLSKYSDLNGAQQRLSTPSGSTKSGLPSRASKPQEGAGLGHMFILHQKGLHTSKDAEPTWLTIERDLPLNGERLARRTVHANAVRSAITHKEKSQGGSPQARGVHSPLNLRTQLTLRVVVPLL